MFAPARVDNRGVPVEVSVAGAGAAAELAALAAVTFPLACPSSVAAADIAAFVTANLSTDRFAAYLADPARVVLRADQDGRIVGYAMLIREADESVVHLSKLYVGAAHHGTGAAGALMHAGIGWATGGGAPAVWLSVNRHNRRAQGFYRKHGFAVTGTRHFRLGATVQEDFVMRRDLLDLAGGTRAGEGQ